MRQGGMWWLAVLGVLVLPGQAFAAEVDTAAVDRFVSDFAERAGHPGVAVAITKGERVVHVAGYGRDSTGSAITASTPMPVASVSKSFTALAVLRLVEQGKVVLDAPVRDYVPDFRLADPRGAGITVRHLLSQTSGITDRTLPEKSLAQPDSLAEAVVRAREATLAVDPGTKHFYTNTNYHLAARVVEVVSGEPFAEYLRRNVFEPLGMRSTTSIGLTPRDLPPTVAKGHIYAYGLQIPVSEPERFVGGSDGVITTAEDMARWLIAQSTGGGGLVRPASMAAMHTLSDPRWAYGMGWNTQADGRVRHSGVWFTHTAGQLLLPSGYGIAVMSNSGLAGGNEGTGQVEDGLATLLEGGTPPRDSSLRGTIELVLALLAVISLVLGVLALRRTPAWVRRFADRPLWIVAIRLLPRLVPSVILMSAPYLLGELMSGGRDLTHLQLAHYSAALVVWLSVAGAMNATVGFVRLVAWRRRMR